MVKLRANKLVWLAVATVLLVNSIILGKVLINRSDILAELPLTERELSLPHRYGFATEDSGTRLRLQWTTLNPEPIDADNQYRYRHTNRSLVLSEQHFASFQFAPCQQRYRQQRQSGWVLLEFNGQSYLDYLAQAERYYTSTLQAEPTDDALNEKQQRATELLQAARQSATRLFVINAAASAELLQSGLIARQTTADARLLIVPAEIQASYSRCNDPKQANSTEIIVSRLVVESLYVPKNLASELPQQSNSTPIEPFLATIQYGKLHEPWISSLE